MKRNQLTQEFINDLFLILKKVHDSHWKPPMVNEILNTLHADNCYEFITGSEEKHMWTCRITITKDGEDHLIVEYHLNDDLPRMMQEKQKEMKKEFDKRLIVYFEEKKIL